MVNWRGYGNYWNCNKIIRLNHNKIIKFEKTNKIIRLKEKIKMILTKLKEELKNKQILILGFGAEGQDNYKFLRKLFPDKILGIGDCKEFSIFNFQFSKLLKEDKYLKLHLGKNYLKTTQDYDVIFKSPGIPFKILPKTILKKITSQTKIFFDYCPGKIIGIAGTKGKGTTSSLIYKILKQAGLNAYLIGNIGRPVLSFLSKAKKDDIFVYELSSYQLMNLKKSPQIAVFLNNYPDHLDYHKNLQEYARANGKITQYQTKKDFLIYNPQDEIVKKIANKSKAKKIPIKGKHYFVNKEAAKTVGKIFNISPKIISKAIKKLKPLPYRLELIGKFHEIIFYNDSASTIPETTIAALDFLKNKVETLILGGSDKNLNFKFLAQKILKSKVKVLILFPITGRQIWQEIIKISGEQFSAKLSKYFFVDNMPEAVKLAYQHTSKGKICLLSPASASFSIFKDYRHRGSLFTKYVQKYSQGN